MQSTRLSLQSRSSILQKSLFIGLVGCVALGTARESHGQRKGFIIGFGLGPGLTSFTQSVDASGFSETSDRQNELALMTDFRIGYAPSDLLLLYWTSRVAWFGMENAFEEDVTIANGIGGLGVSYFLRPAAPTPVINGGIGFSSWMAPFESDVDTWYGLGLLAGVGYEFSRHWIVDLDLIYGNPGTSEDGADVSSSALSFKFSITWLHY